MRSNLTYRRIIRSGYWGPALVTALILLLLLALQVHAAPPGPAPSEDTWQTVEAAPLDGQRVTTILAEPGNLWAGTEERGLAQWDGQAWRTYGVPDGLPDNRVVALFRDRQGRLWVSTGTGLGYLPFDGGSFRRVSLKGVALPIVAIGQAQDGAILLGGPAGLALWQPDGALQRIPEFAGKRVLAVRTTRDGMTWIGTSAGLWQAAGGRWMRVEGAGSSPVTALAEAPDGVLYVFGDNGVFQMKGGAWQKMAALKPGGITAAAVHDGTLWLGGLQGVTAGQGDLWQTYNPGVLPSPAVTALVWDGDGRLWIGTTAGLVQHRPDRRAPEISIRRINGTPAGGGTMDLQTDRIESLGLAVQDQGASLASLRIFVRLSGVDQAPRLLSAAEQQDLSDITVYAGKQLPAGRYVLRAWAQDESFNRSPEAQATFTVPAFARGPAGLLVRRELAFAAVGTLALVLTAGATTGAAASTRRRQAVRAADVAAANIRTAMAHSNELYATTLPLREREVREVVAALEMRGVLLLGEAGAGKTATLGQIGAALQAAADPSRIMVSANVDLAMLREGELFHAVLGAVSDALHPLAAGEWPRLGWSDSPAATYSEQQFSADLGLLLAWLQPQLTQRLTVVLMLDNAGVLDTFQARLRDAFRRLVLAASAANSPVRLVLAAESTPVVMAGFADLFQVVVLAPLSGAVAGQMLREGVRGLVDWDPDAERLAVERAAGNPAALTAIGFAAAQAALAGSRLRILAADVP